MNSNEDLHTFNDGVLIWASTNEKAKLVINKIGTPRLDESFDDIDYILTKDDLTKEEEEKEKEEKEEKEEIKPFSHYYSEKTKNYLNYISSLEEKQYIAYHKVELFVKSTIAH